MTTRPCSMCINIFTASVEGPGRFRSPVDCTQYSGTVQPTRKKRIRMLMFEENSVFHYRIGIRQRLSLTLCVEFLVFLFYAKLRRECLMINHEKFWFYTFLVTRATLKESDHSPAVVLLKSLLFSRYVHCATMNRMGEN